MKRAALLFPLLLFSQADTSTRRVTGQPPKLILALGDVSTSVAPHDSVSHALVAIEGLGLRTGLFDTLIRTDTQLVTKQAVSTPSGTLAFYRNLLDFDAVLLFTSGAPRLTEQQKADLLSFVHDDGKGLVAVHSALSSFASWPDYTEMLGATGTEPAGECQEQDVRVLARGSPPMHLFGPAFRIRDKFVPLENPAGAHVLARTSTGVPVVWTRKYGKGRVFVSQIGHDDAAWDRDDVQSMYLEAIRWVMR